MSCLASFFRASKGAKLTKKPPIRRELKSKSTPSIRSTSSSITLRDSTSIFPSKLWDSIMGKSIPKEAKLITPFTSKEHLPIQKPHSTVVSQRPQVQHSIQYAERPGLPPHVQTYKPEPKMPHNRKSIDEALNIPEPPPPYTHPNPNRYIPMSKEPEAPEVAMHRSAAYDKLFNSGPRTKTNWADPTIDREYNNFLSQMELRKQQIRQEINSGERRESYFT